MHLSPERMGSEWSVLQRLWSAPVRPCHTRDDASNGAAPGRKGEMDEAEKFMLDEGQIQSDKSDKVQTPLPLPRHWFLRAAEHVRLDFPRGTTRYRRVLFHAHWAF